MELIFLGGVYPPEKEQKLREKANGKLSHAANLHQWNIINGIERNIGAPIRILNSYFLPSFPTYRDIWIASYPWHHTPAANDYNAGFINFRGVRQFSRYLSIKRVLKQWLDKTQEYCILCYTMSFPMLKAIHTIKRKYPKLIVCVIVPDVPANIAMYGGKKGLYGKISSGYNLKKIDEYSRCVDKYVLLSEPMKELFQITDDQFCVMDGLFDEFDFAEDANDFKPQDDLALKTIVYTGSLHKEYGICELLKAFQMIENACYTLMIAGSGNALDQVQQACNEDARIKYLGILDKSEVRQLQKKATLLINPRSSKGIDAKYSFPSKTIEYMLSGRPVLMRRLPGMSEEYDGYLYYLDDTNPESMMKSICLTCEKSKEELKAKGEAAKKFIIENKNNVFQTKKILQLIGYEL